MSFQDFAPIGVNLGKRKFDEYDSKIDLENNTKSTASLCPVCNTKTQTMSRRVKTKDGHTSTTVNLRYCDMCDGFIPIKKIKVLI